MKVTNVRWFAGRDCVGIVQVVEEHEWETYRQTGNANFKYYIGVGEGQDEELDRVAIGEWGVQFDKDAGDNLFDAFDYMLPN